MRSDNSERDNDGNEDVSLTAVAVVDVAAALALFVAASAADVVACSSFGNTGTGVPMGVPNSIKKKYKGKEWKKA